MYVCMYGDRVMVVQPESIHYSAKLPDLPWIQYIKLTNNISVRVNILIPPSLDAIYQTDKKYFSQGQYINTTFRGYNISNCQKSYFLHTNVLRLGRCQLPHLCICQSISAQAPWLNICSGDQGTVALLHN